MSTDSTGTSVVADAKRLCDAIGLLWAKIGRSTCDTWNNRHPLACHLLDVGYVTVQLWQRVLRVGPKRRVTRAIGLGDDLSSAGRWLAFWAAAHDIGKAAPGFQSKRADAVRPLTDAGFDFTRRDDYPHQYVSTNVLADVLATAGPSRPALDTELARRVGIAVGGHHGLFPVADQWHELSRDKLGHGCAWHATRVMLLDRLASIFGLTDVPVPQNPTESDSHWPMIVLAGLVSVADWIGSNKEFFPHEPAAVDVAAYAAVAGDRAERALRQLGWLGWTPESSAPKSFAELFPKCVPPRSLQEETAKVAEDIKGPGLVIIEAPMGEGKTEAALYLADQWTHRHGGQGLYVAMPTMATGNQMFSRVREFLQERYPYDVVNLQLLHSAAMLYEETEELRKAAVAERGRQGFAPADIAEDDTGHPGAVVAEAWFAQNGKQAILAPFGVGTVDQALLSVLQVRHGFVRLFGLAGKTVVLDEVHAYDAYMSALLERLLEWLSALGCSVVLLSATLPADKRRSLVMAWGADPPVGDPPYPRLTIAHASTVTVRSFAADAARRKAVSLEWRDGDKLANELAAALAEGGCAAVVCNTVGQAQETFIALRDRLRPLEFEVSLFHARFPFEDRQRIERCVVETFGKGSDGKSDNPRRPPRAVLVATQVIEQSLDLDFDLMVSDVAPADLILQRAGRLHRHDRSARPIQTPTLWLVKPGNFDALPEFGSGHEVIYDRHILLRSVLALRGRSTVMLPDDIDCIVKAVYNGDGSVSAPDAAWRAAIAESRREMNSERGVDRQVAKTFCIAKPTSRERFILNRADLDDENPQRPPEQQAATRLTEPTVQVVYLPWGSGWAERMKPPTLAEARGLLGRAVALRDKRIIGLLLRRPVPPGWRESPLLRFHRLLELDESGACQVGAFVVRADAELGIVVSPDLLTERIKPCVSI